MASPQLEDGYTRIANELLEALCRARLGGREFKVVLAVIRLTYGFLRKESPISLGKLAEMTGLRRERLSEVVKALERKNVLVVSREAGRLVLGLQKDYSKWVSQKRGSPKLGQSQKRVSQKEGTRCPKKGEQGVPKTGNTDHPEILEAQGTAGTLKKNIKENSKEISSKRDETFKDETKEIVSRWEQIFQASFPLPASREEIRAADFMLYLHEHGRLPALKSPAAYLKKLAKSELEPFPSLPERKRQAEEAEARMQKLAEREAELVLLRMKAEAEAEAEAKRRWSEMPHEAKLELLKEMKIRWPRQPTAFWERQAINQIKRQVLSSVWPDNRG